jgi:hypothetical protein
MTTNGIWHQWEVAPAGPGPWTPGPLRHDDGEPLHGVWSRPRAPGRHRLVAANNGVALRTWLVPSQRWTFTSELVRVGNDVLGNGSWHWAIGGRWWSSHPSDAAVGLVRARHKPVGLASTRSARQASAWARDARSDGLLVHEHTSVLGCCGESDPVSFVEVALPGTFGQRFDLDTLLGDYARCLPPDDFGDVVEMVDELRDTALADLLGTWVLLVVDTPGSWVRAGLALGYHPATTAGLILGYGDEEGTTSPLTHALDDAVSRRATYAGLPGLPTSLPVEQRTGRG